MSPTRGTTTFLPQSFRKPHNLLLGRASELARPLLQVASRLASTGRQSAPQSWKRGLIIGHNHMGDVLYRTGSLPVLAGALPECQWTFLTAPQSAPLLANNPHIAEVIGGQRGDNAWSIPSEVFARLRAKRFDVAICSNSLRYYPDLLLSTALGIPNRVSFVHKGMSGLVTHPVPIEFPSAYAAYFRAIVAELTGLPPDWSLRPQVYPDPAAQMRAEAVFTELEVELPVIACVLTTRQAHGNWPPQFLLEILRQARMKAGFSVAFCGSPGDEPLLKAITSSYDHEKAIIAGKLDLPSFAAFLGKCAALVTLDSGPRHLGNAVGIPVIFARNMSHSRIEAGAYCETEVDIAPSGEYLSDEEIEIAASNTPTTRAVNSLIEILSRAQRE